MRIQAASGRRRGEQSTDFRETACCPSAVVVKRARRKMVCVRGANEVTGTLGKANSYFDPTKGVRGSHHHSEAAVDWCSPMALVNNVGAKNTVSAGFI